MITTQQTRMCDVCRLVDFDVSNKLCGYCPLCDAWICSGCKNNWPKRFKAMLKRRLEPGYSGEKDYVEKMEIEYERTRANNNFPSDTM